MILANDREREIYEAGRHQGNAEMVDLAVAGWHLIPPTARDVTLTELADYIAARDHRTLRILRPYDKAEAVTLKEAADIAGKSESAVREWVERWRIGRTVVGSVAVSLPALFALLDDDVPALAAYLSGDRSGPIIEPYLRRAGLPIAA